MPETTAAEAQKNVDAWLRVHADACRAGDEGLCRKARERIAFWIDEALQHG